jgi:ATP-binding cassette subfamily F protein uup
LQPLARVGLAYLRLGQPLNTLSGGESQRLKLCQLLDGQSGILPDPADGRLACQQQPKNQPPGKLLILDEPTNDLDIFVMNVLEDYLRTFEGCLIVVSHDRYFMDKMVDHLFVFEGQGAIKDIIGNYTEYRKQTAVDYKKEKQDKDSAPIQEVKVTQLSNQADKPQEKRKLNFKEKEEFKQLEKDMERLESEKLELTNLLSNPSATNEQIMQNGNRLAEVVSDLEQKTDRWLELSEFI